MIPASFDRRPDPLVSLLVCCGKPVVGGIATSMSRLGHLRRPTPNTKNEIKFRGNKRLADSVCFPPQSWRRWQRQLKLQCT